MADTYPNFEALSQNETSGIDFRILVRGAKTGFALVAPHGGGIEQGTSEIADAIAGSEFSFYAFEGLKATGNSVLHITSTHFDEPMCLAVIARASMAITIHGEQTETDGERVFLGGLNKRFGRRLGAALARKGFVTGVHPNPRLQGTEPENLCNRGASGRGVQLEISRGVRKQMFSSLSREGRKCTTVRFRDFVEAIASVLTRSV
jgi:phage replication-related protein YjqB (UPF0714/DUF867 family)